MALCAACGDSHPDGAKHCPATGDPVTQGPCGTQIDRYSVEKLLGGGGMGAVYRGRHQLLGTPVAIKLLRTRVADNPEIVSRFQREAQAAAAIGNPHIVRVSDFGETALGQPFLVMELLDGADLENVIARRGPLAVDHSIAIALQILDGLAAAHGAGIVHRDLKPGNVFLTHAPGDPTGPRDFVKIVDFGISKITTTDSGHSLTKTGTVLGTPYYMAPEQARGLREQDHRVDVYAAAVIFYQMLARALPFDGESYEELVIRICTEAPRPLAQVAPHVPASLVAAIERGMARDTAQRWPTAAAFADGIRAAAGHGSSLGLGPSTPPPAMTLSPTPAPQALRVAMPVAAGPASPAVSAPPAGAPPAAPSPARRSLVMPAAIAFLGVAILAAAGIAAWIATRDPPPPALVAPVPGMPAVGPSGTPMIALVPLAPTAPPPAPPAPAEDPDADEFDFPSGEEIAEMMQDGEEIANQVRANMPVTPAPDPVRGASVGEPYIIGEATSADLVPQLQHAVAALQRCRRPGGLARLRAQIMLTAMTAAMVTVSGGPREQCDCVANVMRDEVHLVGGAMTSAIVYVEVALAPR